MMDVERACAAQRRRGRRLRAALRHERQSIAMALAEMSHHTAPRGPRMARAGEEGHRNEYEAPRRQKPPPPQGFFQLFDEEDAERGLRPACLAEPRGPQERVQLRTVDHIADVVLMVQILDAPVPRVGEQGVDQLVEAFRHLDLLISRAGYRSAQDLVFLAVVAGAGVSLCSKWRNSLVEVPEFVSFAHAIHRQIADIPIPQVGCLSSGGVQGFLPGQDYFLFLEQTVDIPAPQSRWEEGGGLQSFLPVQHSTAFCGADHRIVVIPARGGLQGSPRTEFIFFFMASVCGFGGGWVFFCALFPLEKSARCRAGGCESAPALQLIRAEPSSNGSSPVL